MSQTPNLNLSYLAAGQAQKHVTLNEALLAIDSLVHIAVAGPPSDTPPPTPPEGSRWLVGADPEADWAGHAGQLAVRLDGGWRFHAAKAGWLAHDTDQNRLRVYSDGTWREVGGPSELQNLAHLGVGTAADDANPFAARLNNALFTAMPTGDGGSGDLRLKINKTGAARTASLVFQTGYSGRAEIGGVGSDDLTFKVSPDGTTWFTGLVLHKEDGKATLAGLTVPDGSFTLSDDGDPTKQAQFNVSAISPGVTRVFNLPNVSGTIPLLAAFSQTFPGQTIFSNTLSTFGSATGAATYGLGSGATTSGLTKTVDIGTGGVSGSTTLINLGSTVSGALGAVKISTPTLSAANTDARFRSLDSAQVLVAQAGVSTVTAPSSGGVVVLSAVDATSPRNAVASLFAYDVGSTPALTSLVLGAEAENLGTTTLTGSSGSADRIAVAVDGSGRLHIQNRLAHGQAQQVCLTFLNGYRAL